MTLFRGRGSEDWLSSPNLYVNHLAYKAFSSSTCYQSENTDITIVIQISKIIICTNILTDYYYVLAGNFGMPNKVIKYWREGWSSFLARQLCGIAVVD